MNNGTIIGASPTDNYLLVGLAVLLISTMLAVIHKRRNNAAAVEDEKKKEQLAKASFRVRKSNLMSIAGRGGVRRNNRKKKQPRLNRDQLITGGESDKAAASWYEWLMSSFFMHMMARLLSIISFGYLQLLDDASTTNTTQSSSQQQQRNTGSRRNKKRANLEGYYDNIAVVGLDCEMVGGGRNGMKSLLARCSVVTLDHIPAQAIDNNKSQLESLQNLTSLNQNLVVLYDKYVIPKEKITDYRTEWSGITKSTYSNNNTNSSIPIVSFQQCQNEITQLFASISNKKVMVVGHALENDFEALEITHPISLVRDTAFFVPYMRQVRTKLYSRKLSALSSEELGIDIQQSSEHPPPLEDEGSDGVSMIQNDSMVGHSSVEDAAAALRLYWNRCIEWEHSLGYPLSSSGGGGVAATSEWDPLSMYLDGCNLPVAMRGVDFKELFANPPQDRDDASNENSSTTDQPRSFSITSRKRDKGNVLTTDWMPVFLSALSPNATPKLDKVSILWDGAKYRDILKSNNGKQKHQRRAFSSEMSDSIVAEITKDGDTVDDVLFDRLCGSDEAAVAESRSHQQIIPLSKAVNILSFDTANQTSALAEDSLSHYVVIRRKGGGSKTHRRLFDKLHLRRPDEGAVCLSGLTNKLQRHSWKLARELQREKGIEKVIECELRRRQDLKHLVVTDDVYLTERLMRSHDVVVLSFMQFSNKF